MKWSQFVSADEAILWLPLKAQSFGRSWYAAIACSAEPTIKKDEVATVIVGLILWVAVLVHEGRRFRSEVCIGAVLDCADSSSMQMYANVAFSIQTPLAGMAKVAGFGQAFGRNL